MTERTGPSLTALLETIGRTLADEPDAVKVTEGQHRGVTVVELFMAPGDVGRVIGRQGRTAQAVRTLVALAADRVGIRAQVEFREAR
ncbi:MAG TPA: KH domain-containing protein [Vicinamibacterales bacterium]